MRISVITASFNSAATIRRTLESVEAQSWKDVEHIVVDGVSRDGTLAIVDEHRHRLAHVVSEPDRGIYDALNKGLQLASGDAVGFLHSNDWYADDGVLARVARIMDREPIDAVFGDVTYYKPGGHGMPVRRFRSASFSPKGIGRGWMPAHPATFVRREVFERFGPFRIDYRIAGDFEWVARTFGRGGIRYRHVPEVFVNMSIGGISTAGLRSTLILNREFLRACRENGIPSSWPRLLSRYPRKLLELVRRT